MLIIKLNQISGLRAVMKSIGFLLLLSGAFLFTGGLLVGKGFPGALFAISGESLVVTSAINLKTAFELKY